MAFSNEELEIIKKGKELGKSRDEVVEALTRYRLGERPQAPVTETPTPTPTEQPLSNRIAEGLGLSGAVDVLSSGLARSGYGPQTGAQARESIPAPTFGQSFGAGLQLGSTALPLAGGAKLGTQVLASALSGYLYDAGSDLAQGNTVGEALTPGVATAIGTVTPPVLKGAGMLVSGAKNVVSGALSKTGEALSGTVPQGVKQSTEDLLSRVPRAIDKGQEYLAEQATKAERLKTATPEVQNAIESGLDNTLIDAVGRADESTKQAYKKMVEIAEAPKTGLRPSVRPESVAGDAVAEQYKILNTQRQKIGSKLGDAVDKLSTKGAVDVLPAQRGMRQLLLNNGIKPDISGKLNFSGSSLTPKQQSLMQQLYEISTQSETMTPRQVYNMDKLFSQLQREARFDGLDNLYLSTPEGDINAFRAFRNIFSNQLDQIAPEIAPLNKKYAQLRNLQDDIEGSIVKRGNYESTRNVDPSEFAQTNLRRAFSDAQSAADYRELADKLDAFARANGYTGANALDLAGFAQRLRQVYPETVPETSAQGLFGGGIKGAIEKVLKTGAPDITDQQKALRELLGISKADGGGSALAAGAGVGQDENGDASFDPMTAALAMAGMKVGGAGVKKAMEELISQKEANLYVLTKGKTDLGEKVSERLINTLKKELKSLKEEYKKRF